MARVRPRTKRSTTSFAFRSSQLAVRVLLGAALLLFLGIGVLPRTGWYRVETVLSGIKKGLESDQSVTLTGFGTFQLRPRKARVGRNPHSGEPIEIGPGLRVGFRVGKALKEAF